MDTAGAVAAVDEQLSDAAAAPALLSLLHRQTALAQLARRALVQRSDAAVLADAVAVVAGALHAAHCGVVAVEQREQTLPRSCEALDQDVTHAVSAIIHAGDQLRWRLRALAGDGHTFTAGDAAFVEAVAEVLSAAIARSQTERELWHEARHDPATGLPGRRRVTELLDDALTATDVGGVAVVLLVFDQLAAIDDASGDGSGDRVVGALSEQLRRAARPHAVARVADDTFGVVAADLGGEAELTELVRRLASALNCSFPVGAGKITLRPTIGASSVVDRRHSAAGGELLRQARQAVVWSRRDGRSEGCFAPSMDDRARAELHLEGELHRAVEAGELLLHYQPQVDMLEGRVVGVEALIRWSHPQLGLLHPERFIGVAERTGLVVDVDRWVLDAACQQLAQWWRRGVDVPRIGVNLSPATLHHDDLAPWIERTLARHGVSPHQLEVEIAEHSGMLRRSETMHALKELRSLGVRLAIDDFGTGHSSLSSLHRFAFDTLKVDGGFMSRISGSGDAPGPDEAILKTIVALAGHLSLDLVMEGVESTLQRDFLLMLGCRYAQGFLYCRPVVASELADVLCAVQSATTAGGENGDASDVLIAGVS